MANGPEETGCRIVVGVDGSITYCSLLSVNTGVAPVIAIAPTVAMNVLGEVITSSPGPIPISFIGKMSESVPELTPIAYGRPIIFAKRPSNSVTALPSVKSPVNTSSRMSAR